MCKLNYIRSNQWNKEISTESKNEFIEFLNEMFCQDGETLSLKWINNKLNIFSDNDNIGYVVVCNVCGYLKEVLHEGGSTWETSTCNGCSETVTKIGDSNNIEW